MLWEYRVFFMPASQSVTERNIERERRADTCLGEVWMYVLFLCFPSTAMSRMTAPPDPQTRPLGMAHEPLDAEKVR